MGPKLRGKVVKNTSKLYKKNLQKYIKNDVKKQPKREPGGGPRAPKTEARGAPGLPGGASGHPAAPPASFWELPGLPWTSFGVPLGSKATKNKPRTTPTITTTSTLSIPASGTATTGTTKVARCKNNNYNNNHNNIVVRTDARSMLASRLARCAAGAAIRRRGWRQGRSLQITTTTT